MIDTAITAVAGQLDQALKRQFVAMDDWVVVSNLHEQDGTVATQVVNKVAAFLVGIARAPGVRS